MGLTSSLFAGLSGMKTNEFRMDVIGDNIANVNTYGFKSSRVNFQNQFLNTFSYGSAPDGNFGGSNPKQIGTGVGVGSINRNFAGGAPETTGKKNDLAILGQGLFILEKPDGTQVYTRDGSFEFNGENYLMSSDGYYLQGYGVDDNFNIVEGTLERIRLPIGEITTATSTTEASFSGNLNAEGAVPTNRSVLTTVDALTIAGGVLAGAGTALVDLEDAGGNPLFYDGNVITMTEATKGTAQLEEREFVVGAATTVDDFMVWLEDVLGIATTLDDPDLLDITGDPLDMPGVRFDAVTGNITITCNIGEYNQIGLASGAFTASQGTGATAPYYTSPFAFGVTTAATGEGARTSFRGYDSLGIPVDITMTLALESQDNNGSIWRYFADSGDDTDDSRFLGTGTISFDTDGNFRGAYNTTFTVDHADTGAQTPQSITFDFGDLKGLQGQTAITLLSQDGFPSGTLQDYGIGVDGIIVGSFSNGQSKALGQVVLSTFRNYEALIAEGDNLYKTGPNSGDAIVKKPQFLGAGQISSGALELSNVDLSREFINLIVSSTGFSASSRVIQTSDQLLDELIMLTR
ncbi:MAG: flagellar hook-basal body complex protein [Sedimentisphaerales bacterium]|nr:flagellar hook-basal body complex protein [Sedimentisphaerales bacterium]